VHSLQGLAPATAPLATRLAQINPDIVIFNERINDEYVLDESPTDYAAWELQALQTARAANRVPVFAESNPVCENTTNPATAQFTPTTVWVLNSVTLPPLYLAYTQQPNWQAKLMSSDCVHPNNAMYASKESQYFPALLPIVKKMLDQ
jgi:hypothetical protein